MNNKTSDTRNEIFSGLLMTLALVAGLLFNGAAFYLLALSWASLIILSIYSLANVSEVDVRLDLIHLLMFLFFGWMLVSLYWHPAPWRGIAFGWRLGIFFYTALVAYLFLNEKNAKSVFAGFVFVVVIDCIYTLYQSMFLGDPAASFFLNKNNNAAFINMFIPPVIAHLLFRDNRSSSCKEWAYSVLLVLMLLAVLQVASRGALISLVIALSVVLAFAVYDKRIKNILFVSLISLLVFVLDSLLSNVEMASGFSSQARWYLYTSTIEMIGDSRWYGIGNGMFPFFYPEYRNAFEVSAGNFVHNDYLQVLLELGMPGFVFLLSMMAVMAYKFRKLVLRAQDMKSLAPYIGYFSAILVVSAHSMLTFNFYKAGILVVLGVYFGLLLRGMNKNEVVGHYDNSSLRVGVGIKLIVILALLVPLVNVSALGYADAIVSGVADRKFYDRKPEDRYRIYIKLSQLDKKNYRYPARAAHALSMSGVGAMPEKRREIFFKSMALLEHAKELNPLSIETYVYNIELLSDYQTVSGQQWRKEAIDISSKLLDMNPRLVGIRVKLARFLEDSGQKKDALNILLEGLQHAHVSNPDYYTYGKTLSEEIGSKYAYKRFSYLLDKYRSEQVREYVLP